MTLSDLNVIFIPVGFKSILCIPSLYPDFVAVSRLHRILCGHHHLVCYLHCLNCVWSATGKNWNHSWILFTFWLYEKQSTRNLHWQQGLALLNICQNKDKSSTCYVWDIRRRASGIVGRFKWLWKLWLLAEGCIEYYI